jgi:putative glutathione S-transferase
MVYVIDGVAHEGHKTRGDEYKREPTKFSHAGPIDLENSDLHLYVSAACPWAHRALLTRNLSQKLRQKITVSVVSPFRDDAIGWEFLSDKNRETVKQFTAVPVTKDQSPLKANNLLEVYLRAEPTYTGNITTPTLYDAKSNTILSNDSFGIMRHLVETVPDELGYLYTDPEAIDREGRTMDVELASRVYMCGLAKTQKAYEESLGKVFAELDRLEDILSDGRSYLLDSNNLSLADVQLVACLVRFDPVYVDLFKCFTRRVSSYKYLPAYLRRATETIGPEALCLDLDQIVNHYYSTFTSANPNGIIPLGYRKDFLNCGKDRFVHPPNHVATSEHSQGGSEQDQSNAEDRKAKGEYVRGVSTFRHRLGGEDFPLEEDRYVLFVANNCPWCHRTLIARSVYPRVEKFVKTSVLFYRRGEEGWRFLPTEDGEFKTFEMDRPDLLTGIDGSDPTKNGFASAKEIYKLSEPTSTQKSVPILFDTMTKRVVSNESADIVKMFARVGGAEHPAGSDLANTIEAINARVYQEVNNGAYRAGFSSHQESYEDAVTSYFRALSWLDEMLGKTKYLVGNEAPTEADVRLFPTIFRHDPVYFSRMKLNVAMVRDYPNLNRWLLDMKKLPGVMEASRLDHCIAGYFGRTGNNLVPFVGLDHDGIKNY